MRPIALAFAFLCALATTAIAAEKQAQGSDSCRRQLSESLIAAVAAVFPGYRAPYETDNLEEDIEYSREHGGDGCLGVAVGDFNGDKATDYLLGLTASNDPSGLVVVALRSKTGWKFQKLRSWVEAHRNRQYVGTVKPGRYRRTEALDGPVAETEKLSMQCPHAGALVGATESTGIVYCYIGGKWHYVLVSD